MVKWPFSGEKKKCPFLLSPANKYMLNVNDRNTGKSCEIGSKLTIKMPERHCFRGSGAFIASFERISHLFLKFLWLTLSIFIFTGVFGELTFTNFNILFKNYFIFSRWIKTFNSKWKKIAKYCTSIRSPVSFR